MEGTNIQLSINYYWLWFMKCPSFGSELNNKKSYNRSRKSKVNKSKNEKLKTAMKSIRNEILNILIIYSPNETNSINKLMKL